VNVSREAISVALFNLLANNENLDNLCNTITRQPLIWTAVDSALKPFLTLFKGGPAAEEFIQPQQKSIGLTKYHITYNLWLYVQTDPSGQINGETVVNNIADAIDAAMQGQGPYSAVTPGQDSFAERQTLGGLVNNAWIDGGNEWGREFEDNNIVVMWKIGVETGI
jgi:hypothetical protein